MEEDNQLHIQLPQQEEQEEIVPAASGEETSSAHQVLDIPSNDTKIDPRPLTLVLSFTNLTYSVNIRNRRKINKLISFPRRLLSLSRPSTADDTPTTPNQTKTILNDISGEAHDGEILALLGASGSGKTTLLDALANRIERESLRGTVTLNGEFVDSRISKALTAYVMQDDLLFPTLTVEETLSFAAEFRLPRTLDRSKKKARVQALIDQLGLKNAAGTIIGDEGRRGVSGGERRRVSIGVDVIHDPILLFLDEPTSGLDSTSAFTVVKVLKQIATSGSIVVMSVHQPSYRILGLLDRLIFLSGGQTVFTGSPSDLPLFFSGFGHPIAENANQIEFALDLISELENSLPSGINGLVEFNNAWRQNREVNGGRKNIKDAPSLKEALNAAVSSGKLMISSSTTSSSSINNIPNFANPLWKESLVLFKRSVTVTKRTPELLGTRLLTILATAFLLATIYWRLDESPKGVRERLGFFAFAIAATYFSSCQTLPLFLQERHIFMRETAYNAYRRSSYVVSHTIAALPALLLLSLAFSIATFWAVGLSGGILGFAFYTLALSASFWAGNSLVVFLSGVVPHVLVGYTVVVAVSAYFLLLSGFFISRKRIPGYWVWFHYLSLIKYPYEAVVQNEFESVGGGGSRCFVRGVEIFDTTPFAAAAAEVKERALGELSTAVGMGNVTGSTCVTSGVDVLLQQGITELGKWECLVVLVSWGFFYRALFYLSLLLGSKNKRK